MPLSANGLWQKILPEKEVGSEKSWERDCISAVLVELEVVAKKFHMFCKEEIAELPAL